jgi:hypothetical protein
VPWILVVALSAAASDPATSPPLEHLVVIAPDHRVVAEADGGPSSIVIDPAIDLLLQQPNAQLTLTHNHPRSAGFSADDLLQLAKPGVVAIVAIGADGSRYEAARGPLYDQKEFEQGQYNATQDVVLRLLLRERARLNGRNLDGHVAHVISLALHLAGVIVYRAALKGDRGIECFDHRIPFSRVATAAAARLNRLR